MKKYLGKPLYVTSLAILALVCFCMLVVGVGVVSTKPLSMQVGMTLTNPLAYFNRQVDDDISSSHGLRDSYVMTPDSMIFVYSRRFVFPSGRVIASRSITFTFDTNGTLVSMDSSGLSWPMFGF